MKYQLPICAFWLAAFACGCAAADGSGAAYSAAERKHWSLRPRAHPAVPVSRDPWATSPIDAFVLEKLKEQGLIHAASASRQTLIRRVYLDLTGIPPTPEQVRSFVADRSPKAYETLVDRLLASPDYAERQARHWLDVVRFAESDGFEYDTHRSEAWQYRDYVIRSFAEDKPYDQFVTEQLAGDEIDPKNHQMLVAASFNRLGPYRRNAGNQDKAYIRNEILTEMTNVVGSAFLGVTLGCARCHDHKFDPIRHTDYYRMQSFFSTTVHHDIPLSTEAEKAAWKERTAAVNQELAALKKQLKEAAAPDKAAIEQVIGVTGKTGPSTGCHGVVQFPLSLSKQRTGRQEQCSSQTLV